MELTSKIRALMFASVAIFSFVPVADAQSDTSRSSFLKGLESEEERVYNELVNRIQTMQAAEYTVFLQERLEQSFIGKNGPMRAYVVVDVTAEMNQPEPGFVKSLFSSASDPKQHGISKLEKLMNVMASSKASTREAFKLEDQYRSQNRIRRFQRVQGMLNETEAKLLVGQSDIVDVFIVDEDKLGTEFITTHTPTGRMLPRRVQKNYSDEYVADGLYQELLVMFDENEVLPVEVSFKKPEGYEYSRAWHDRMSADVDALIESWGDYDFQVEYKNHSHVVLKTTKAHVETMREDESVNFIKYKNLLLNLLKKGI